MSAANVTVCLLNWRRPQNLRLIVAALAAQKPRPLLFLWNNGEPLELEGIDWQIDSSRNMGCGVRWQMGVHAPTEFVCSWDDDLLPGDPHVLRDAAACLAERGGILGAFGVQILAGKDYRNSRHVLLPAKDTEVDIVKGRLLMARTAELRGVPACPERYALADDLWLSSRIHGPHAAAGLFHGRLGDLPAPHAVCGRPGHYKERDRAWRELVGPTRSGAVS